MAKDKIQREELASKLVETAPIAEDPLRAMAELLTDFVMETEVTKVGDEPHDGLIFWSHGLVRRGSRVQRTSNRYVFAAFLSISPDSHVECRLKRLSSNTTRDHPFKSPKDIDAYARSLNFLPALAL